jgi:hypothetical protein
MHLLNRCGMMGIYFGGLAACGIYTIILALPVIVKSITKPGSLGVIDFIPQLISVY